MKRVKYFDLLRAIACLAVIMIHASGSYVEKDMGSINFWAGNFFDSIARIGVPLFVMISGALLLDKNYEYSKEKLIKHIKKIVLFFLFWSCIYAFRYSIIECYLTNQRISITRMLSALIGGHYHLWYVYLLLGLYLITPLLRLWIKDENKKYIEYYLVISIVLSFTIANIVNIASMYSSIFAKLLTVINRSHINYFGGYATYFVLGWYIHNYPVKHKKYIYLAGVICFIITFIGTYLVSKTSGKLVTLYNNLSVNILAQGLFVFVLIKELFSNESKKLLDNKIVLFLSSSSLGIYAIHPLILDKVALPIIKHGIENAFISIPVLFTIVLVISAIIIGIMKKIPVLKNVV